MSTQQPLPASDPTTEAHITDYHATRCLASPLYAFLLSPAEHGLRLTHASRGRVVFRLPVAACHLNAAGGLHGSVSATIVDWAGGLAVAAWDLRGGTGVSVDIHVSYVSSVRLGEEVEIEGSVDKVGGSLAFTTVGVWKVEEGRRGAVVITGRHTKFVRGKAPAK
ncbi:Acyl-coenzyme A thioesterase 13 like protein [Verticillium longisporum]|uniref:Acyl-coenzyme A thioesterase 13 like protein n=1 Tax=Verticillium longisporum TaxID=100787 RepID=A0A8I2ZAV3_VERLO|nr:Acyl-coenzyme A thioesterase 13 like protein [Verticillium longisporum]